jgi:hypothetical protein
VIGASKMGAVAKMVIGESRNFPELARIWRDEIVGPMLAAMTGLIERAQARGEVRPGDARFYAVQVIGPFLVSMIWRETFVPVGETPFDLESGRSPARWRPWRRA